jgi:hypothetical protein
MTMKIRKEESHFFLSRTNMSHDDEIKISLFLSNERYVFFINTKYKHKMIKIVLLNSLPKSPDQNDLIIIVQIKLND